MTAYLPDKQSLPLTTHFPRPLEANAFAQQLLGSGHQHDAYRGYLYLAAATGTGKSDFLAHDLLPALVAHGSLPVCVTTGFDQPFTPGELIMEAIKRAIATVQGSRAHHAPTVGPTNVDITRRQTVHWSKLRKPGNVSIISALRTLLEVANKPLVLVIDEAHHALTGAPGRMAISALKKARIELFRFDQVTLRLLMVGSDREKLRRVEQALHGNHYDVRVSPLPPLHDAFVQQIAVDIAREHLSDTPLDVKHLIAAFTLFDRRPGLFIDAITRVLSQLSVAPDARLEDCIMQAAEQHRVDQETLKEVCYLSFTPLDQAILAQIFLRGKLFEPFTPLTLLSYRRTLGNTVTVAQVQAAMTGLCRRSPALIWSWRRGGYAINDDAWQRWYERRVRENRWPPQA